MSTAESNASEGIDAPATKSGTGSKGSHVLSGPSLAVRCINFGVFQAAWFACVLGAARGWLWAAPAAALVAVAVHLTISSSRRAELLVLLGVASIGVATDMTLVATGVVGMRREAFGMATTSVWFASLWIVFATTLNSSMRWLTHLRHQRVLVAMLFGAIGGPMAYLAGQRLGAVALPLESSLVVLAFEWSILTPLAVAIAARSSAERSASDGATATAAVNGRDLQVRP